VFALLLLKHLAELHGFGAGISVIKLTSSAVDITSVSASTLS
jgi:hypothetical protein